VRQLVVYTGLDDGGERGAAPADRGVGTSRFRIEFGPSYSAADHALSGLRNHVEGAVIDNDVLMLSATACNTTEATNTSAWLRSPAAAAYGGARGGGACAVTLSYEAAWFFGSEDAASRASSARAFAVVAHAASDEGVLGLVPIGREAASLALSAAAVGAYGGIDDDDDGGDAQARLRANVVNVTQLSNRSAAATFAGAGAVTLVVNGTDDRVDDGDVTYPVFVDTCVGFDLPSDGSYS